jgi:long-chain acyl-CoA synthetase
MEDSSDVIDLRYRSNFISLRLVKTLIEILATVVAQNSSRIAVVEGETAVSYSDLEKAILSLAAQLSGLGIRPGDRIAILLSNGSDFIIGYFAVVFVRAIVVPLNEQYQESELSHFLKETGAALIITSQPFASLCQKVVRSNESPCRVFVIDELSQQPVAVTLGSFAADPDAPVMYQFSSGSTGRPKRIARTHRNLVFELNSLIRTLGLTHEDRFLGVTPFSHVNGLMRSMMASLRAGATLYPLPKFERQAIVEMIEKHRISVFTGVPFMFGVMAKTNYGRRPDFSSLRLCISASAPMPPKLNRQFYDKFGIHVRQLYGSTETGTISANLSTEIERSLESVGKPIAGVEVEVYEQNGQPAQVDEVGEIAVKSPAAIKSYDGSGEQARESFRNGYFFTGDLGRRDQDGLLYLVGRKKFLINKGGYKINPQEIEALLETHPKVEEAVVLGVPTSFGDEKVKAVVVLSGPCTEKEIIEHCRGRVADFKIPSLIEFREALPKTATGKVQRSFFAQPRESQ